MSARMTDAEFREKHCKRARRTHGGQFVRAFDFEALYSDAISTRASEAELIEVLTALVNKYVANQSCPGDEFIVCITPGRRTKESHTWKLWDAARAALSKATPPRPRGER